MTSREEEQQPMTTREGITCYERDEMLCEDQVCIRNGCRMGNERLASRHADDYEKRIREKVWSSKCLTNGEWVYLVGLFQTARDHENCGDQPSRPDAGGGVRLPHGYALVPTKPTPAMIEAGCEQNPTQWNEGTDLGFAADVANDVYIAMVSAAALSTPPAAVESASSDPPDRREIVARETCSDCGYRDPCDEKCPNCNDANEYGDYEGPTCEVCGGTGRFPGRSGNQGKLRPKSAALDGGRDA